MVRLLFVLLSILPTLAVFAEPIRVGMFYGANHLRATVSITAGSYDLEADGEILFRITASETMDINASGSEVHVFYKSRNYTGLAKVKMVQTETSQFKVQPAGAKASSRVYEQNLIAFPYSDRLQFVNELEVEDYVGGVIEAESGSGQELEYYKVQAVISRTYALNNLQRHAAEGFQVCDATHCQVFHGQPRIEKKARQATAATRDMVIVDDDINLITAAFHSNCGGHTVNAEEVWSKPLSYCIGRADTFCLKMPHSNWVKTIARDRWTTYLENKRFPLADNPTEQDLTYYPVEKMRYYEESGVKIPMKTIREDFKLRSAFFAILTEGDSITFVGQGFGHGVGLCQEGAMKMALLGRKYEEIVHYYYKNVHLIPRYLMWFYKE